MRSIERGISNDISIDGPGFQGHGIFEVEYVKTVHLRDNVSIEH